MQMEKMELKDKINLFFLSLIHHVATNNNNNNSTVRSTLGNKKKISSYELGTFAMFINP